MDLELAGRVAIVGGASQGIGRATALTLAAEGCHVVMAARREDVLSEAASEAAKGGAQVLAVPADLTSAQDAERLVAATVERFGRIDALVTSIHFSPRGTDDADWQESFDVLFMPAARLTRLVTPHMASGGAIVHLSSIWGKESGGRPGYNAMKAALISHAKAMALELAPVIRVNAISPGYVLTPMQRAEYTDEMLDAVNRKIPMGRHCKPEEIAALFAFLASEDAAFVTGHVYVMDGAETTGGLCSQWAHT